MYAFFPVFLVLGFKRCGNTERLSEGRGDVKLQMWCGHYVGVCGAATPDCDPCGPRYLYFRENSVLHRSALCKGKK
jgi:hypothetical protein